ncbi:hypothetical protein [Gelidibacter sp. F63206]|uniref:hypothetical protein n=1 Tax=Gelidibacter sp. F63206 TaxID=2926425 RepID=UPI001FF4C384|nr:hypothetical protein [Gelidibacter sp. F63206]MCK0115232.1 hypothetical protein [Gelidibacter sp. F63206]
MHKTLFIILTFFFATVGVSQEKFTGNYEPIIGLEYDLNHIIRTNSRLKDELTGMMKRIISSM